MSLHTFTRRMAADGDVSASKFWLKFLRRKSGIALVLAVCFQTIGCTSKTKSPVNSVSTEPASDSRKAQLVEANIVAVQAYQMVLARQAGIAPSVCYPATPDTATLEGLVKHQESLLAEPLVPVVEWADSKPSQFDPGKDLEPLLHAGIPLSPKLPVNVFTRYLQAEAPGKPQEEIRSVANLYQTVLGVERDGTVLQDLYRFYIALKLPVYIGQFGLPGTDADMLAAGQKLAGQSCASPVDLSASAWQLAGRKIWNWGEKNLHIRDVNTLATEMLHDPQVVPLIPAMKAMKPEKIAVIGDSYTMNQHWSSPGAFPGIVAGMFARENPQVQFRRWSHGGLDFSRVYGRYHYYDEAIAWKPNVVLLVAENHTDADMAAMNAMIEGFRAQGVRVYMFDDVEWPDAERDPARIRQVMLTAKRDGAAIIPSRAILNASPDHASFPAMDGIHKTEPYHRLMATLWLKAILKDSAAHSSRSR